MQGIALHAGLIPSGCRSLRGFAKTPPRACILSSYAELKGKGNGSAQVTVPCWSASAAASNSTAEREGVSVENAKSAFVKRALVLGHTRSRTIRLLSEFTKITDLSRPGLNQSTAFRIEGCSFKKPLIWPSTIGRMICSRSSITTDLLSVRVKQISDNFGLLFGRFGAIFCGVHCQE